MCSESSLRLISVSFVHCGSPQPLRPGLLLAKQEESFCARSLSESKSSTLLNSYMVISSAFCRPCCYSEAARCGCDSVDNDETARHFWQAPFHSQAIASAHSSNLALHLRIGTAVQPRPRPTSCPFNHTTSTSVFINHEVTASTVIDRAPRLVKSDPHESRDNYAMLGELENVHLQTEVM
ncbi:hypothetical protein M758_2G021100 [Ceratodon purpureus]|nr:hypothetical protein M758_2G021100 [Ceratodon purpureus]